jgi:glutamyl-tRNA reductase
MNILIVGLNHKTAGVEIREKIAFNQEKLFRANEALKAFSEIEEFLILSTCNRVELYLVVKDVQSGIERILNFLSEFHQVDRKSIEKALYQHTAEEAIRHGFCVASSLDSMILGEPQILGQLKDSFEFSLVQKTTGVILNKFMRKAISVAKRIRTETGIAQNAVSISFAAVDLAKKIFDTLANTTIMLLGAGEMAELAARHLVSNGVQQVFIANRTYARAVELARTFNGKPIAFEDFKKELVHTDIVLCSTGAANYVLKKDEMRHLMKERRQKPMFVIDITVPRNIDPEINHIDNVYLYDIDDLQGLVNNNLMERKNEAAKAQAIVDEEIQIFLKWYNSLHTAPTITALRKKAEMIRKAELERATKRLNGIGQKDLKTIDAMTQAIVNKLIHAPTAALRSDSDNSEELNALIRRLYDLDEVEK